MPLGLSLRLLDQDLIHVLRVVGSRRPALALTAEALLEKLNRLPAIDEPKPAAKASAVA